MDASVQVNNVSSFCAKDDQETSLVCLTQEDPPSCCFPDYPQYFTIIVATYWLLLSVVGGFGNLVVLVAIPYARWKTTDPRSPLNNCATLLLINLSLADCLCSFISLPGWAVSYVYRKWVLGTTYCYIFGFLAHYVGLVSPTSLAAATLSRTLALWWPKCHEVVFESYSSVPALLATWMLPAVVPTFIALQHGFGYSRTKGYCHVIEAKPEENILYGIALYLPWAMALGCLLLIWIKLRQNWCQLRRFRFVGANTLRDLKEREKKMAILLTLLGAAYSSVSAPVVAILIFSKEGPWSKPYIYFTAFLLYYYAINVFLYIYRIPSYRDAFILLYKDVCGWFHKEDPSRQAF